MKLREEEIIKIIVDCLFEEHNDETECIFAECISISYAFDPARIDAHADEIKELLDELPEEFKECNGGQQFGYACIDKHSYPWATYDGIEMLLTLGMASGYLEPTVPKEQWEDLHEAPSFKVLSERKHIDTIKFKDIVH